MRYKSFDYLESILGAVRNSDGGPEVDAMFVELFVGFEKAHEFVCKNPLSVSLDNAIHVLDMVKGDWMASLILSEVDGFYSVRATSMQRELGIITGGKTLPHAVCVCILAILFAEAAYAKSSAEKATGISAILSEFEKPKTIN